MRIEPVHGAEMTFEEWGKYHGLELVARERPCSPGSHKDRWYVRFDKVEVMTGGCLAGVFGNGATPEEARCAYEIALRGRRIAHRPMSAERREIQCPNEWRTA